MTTAQQRAAHKRLLRKADELRAMSEHLIKSAREGAMALNAMANRLEAQATMIVAKPRAAA